MKIFVIGLLVAGTCIAGASLWNGVSLISTGANLTAVTNITVSAKIPLETRQLTLENQFGPVHVHGTTSGPGQWTWQLTVRARSQEEARRVAQSIQCQPTQTGGSLALKVLFPNKLKDVSVESEFDVSAPSEAAVKVRDAFGAITVADLQGNLEVFGQNGEVNIGNIGGEVHAETSFAALKAANLGPARLFNQNGEISAAQIKGPLEAGTSFASLRAETIGGRAHLHNQNGEILVRDVQGSLEAQTSFSPLRAKNISGNAALENQNGEIRAEAVSSNANLHTSFAQIEVKDVGGEVVLENQNGGIEASAIAGTVKANTSFSPLKVSGRGARFDCHNQNGSIYIQATSSALASIQAETSFDGMEVRIPAPLKPVILAKTSFGEINSDFPVYSKLPNEGQAGETRSEEPQIRLENQNGGIRIVGQN